MCMFEVLKLIWVKWIGGSRLSLMVTIWGVAFYSLLLSIDIYPFIHTCIHLTMLGSAQGGIGLIECFVVLALAVEHLNYSVQKKKIWLRDPSLRWYEWPFFLLFQAPFPSQGYGHLLLWFLMHVAIHYFPPHYCLTPTWLHTIVFLNKNVSLTCAFFLLILLTKEWGYSIASVL